MTQPDVPSNEQKGRGPLILTFGLLSFFLFGPFLGLPAWIMGVQDLRKIREGVIAASEKGLIMGGTIIGAVGTFFSPTFIGALLAFGLGIFSGQAISAHRTVIETEIRQISIHAQQYRMESGEATYEGFTVPADFQSGTYATYELKFSPEGALTIKGTSVRYPGNSVSASLDLSGELGPWMYSGTEFGSEE